NQAVHGDDAVELLLGVGKIDGDYIRYQDAHAQARAGELWHPDVIPLMLAHDWNINPYWLAKHDMFHAVRSSSELFQPFLRHLRDLLTRETGFYMSQPLWDLSDMDKSGGQRLRTIARWIAEAKDDNYRRFLIEEYNSIKSVHVTTLLNSAGRHQ